MPVCDIYAGNKMHGLEGDEMPSFSDDLKNFKDSEQARPTYEFTSKQRARTDPRTGGPVESDEFSTPASHQDEDAACEETKQDGVDLPEQENSNGKAETMKNSLFSEMTDAFHAYNSRTP